MSVWPPLVQVTFVLEPEGKYSAKTLQTSKSIVHMTRSSSLLRVPPPTRERTLWKGVIL